YVAAMPVTSHENQLRGLRIWGLPKSVHPIELRQVGDDFVTTVESEEGAPLLSFSVPMRSGSLTPLMPTARLHSQLDGTWLHATAHYQGQTRMDRDDKVLLGYQQGRSRLWINDATPWPWLQRLSIQPIPFVTQFATDVQSLLTLPER